MRYRLLQPRRLVFLPVTLGRSDEAFPHVSRSVKTEMFSSSPELIRKCLFRLVTLPFFFFYFKRVCSLDRMNLRVGLKRFVQYDSIGMQQVWEFFLNLFRMIRYYEILMHISRKEIYLPRKIWWIIYIGNLFFQVCKINS